MAIKMITCVNEEGYIGLNGDLLYHLKKDLAWFKEKTLNSIILCGRSTWESLPQKPLPNRINTVLSSNPKYKVPNGVFLAHSKEQVLNHYLESGKNEKSLWIIGGQQLYESMLEYAEEVFLTRVKDNKVGDTSFPIYRLENLFNLVEDEVEEHEEDGVEFTFEKWIRKDNIKDPS